MRKSIGVVNWLKASTDAALTLHPASAQVRTMLPNSLLYLELSLLQVVNGTQFRVPNGDI